MATGPAIYVESRSVQERNEHWGYCRRSEIPYVTVYRRGSYVSIDWDLWAVDVAGLGLTLEASQAIDRYLRTLVADSKIQEWGVGSVYGFAKVKREVESEVIAKIWAIVSDSKNWSIKGHRQFSVFEGQAQREDGSLSEYRLSLDPPIRREV